MIGLWTLKRLCDPRIDPILFLMPLPLEILSGVTLLMLLIIFCVRYHSIIFFFYDALAEGYTGLLT